jgi:replication factor C subunit 1
MVIWFDDDRCYRKAGPLSEKDLKKKEEEQNKIKETAKAMGTVAKQAYASSEAPSCSVVNTASNPAAKTRRSSGPPDMRRKRLRTFAATRVKSRNFVNGSKIGMLSPLLRASCMCSRMSFDRPKNLRADFKKPGPNGMNVYRSVLISGPPGIGKTTSAHLAAELAGFTVLELNASDTRSKTLLNVRKIGFSALAHN